MSANKIKIIDALTLKAQLHDGGELALLDAREELLFGRRHLLMASCIPLSRLELLVVTLVKPQYEAPAEWAPRGVVPRERLAGVLAMCRTDVRDLGWKVRGERESPLTGHGGNFEYLWWLVPVEAGA